MPSNAADYSKWVAIVISLLALGHTVLKDRKLEKRVKKVEEEQEREKKDTAVRRSKSSAPYFTPSKKFVALVYEDNENGGISIWQSGSVLSVDQKEMPKDTPVDTPILLLLDLYGKGARQIKITGETNGAELKVEPDISDAHGLIYLKYPYVPANHGKIQKLYISFETEDGYDLTHTYETRHGQCEFRRIDPA